MTVPDCRTQSIGGMTGSALSGVTAGNPIGLLLALTYPVTTIAVTQTPDKRTLLIENDNRILAVEGLTGGTISTFDVGGSPMGLLLAITYPYNLGTVTKTPNERTLTIEECEDDN